MTYRPTLTHLCVLLLPTLLIVGAVAQAQRPDKNEPSTRPAKIDRDQHDADEDADDAEVTRDGKKYVPLELKLPRPAFKGTPTNVPPGTNLEKPRKGPRKPIKVPPGVRNVALKKKVTSSDEEPIIGNLKLVTNGKKEATEGEYVELGPMKQWVQIDLKDTYEIHAIVIWHYHLMPRVYHDVVVQISDDKDFIEDVETVFNNDHDNSAGLGLGKDKEFWDTFEGKLLKVKGVEGRYVRLYSQGSTADDMNHYTEVEVYALPAE